MAVTEALFFLAALAAPVLAQPGFLSLDCGLAEGSDYADPETGISYISDNNFTDNGESREIDSSFLASSSSQVKRLYRRVRSFPEGDRNCYTLTPVEKGSKYWVRASFMHGNYDGSNALPQFDLYIGINKWTTVSLQKASQPWWTEMVTMATMDFITVCLMNVGMGKPFISALELRLLNSSMYWHANETQSLVVHALHDIFGDRPVRYPDDGYDRLWMPFSQLDAPPSWERLTTSKYVRDDDTDFEPPLAVMKSAATLRNGSGKVLFFNWSTTDPAALFYCYIHIADFQNSALREFYSSVDGGPPIVERPPYLAADYVYSSSPVTGSLTHEFTFEKTRSSTLPPILNAVEIYTVVLLNQSSTDAQDVYAIMGTKQEHKVKRDWMGDPCLPSRLTWDGIRCSYDSPFPPRIVFLNLSSSGLTGKISTYIGKLTWIQYLDLSNNNMTGSVPEFLANLTYLKHLNLSGNNFTSIPLPLLEKSKSGFLTLSVDETMKVCVTDSCNATDPCSHGSCQRKATTVYIPVIVSSLVTVAVALLIALIFWCVFGRRYRGSKESSSLGIESRSFTYAEIANITNNFSRVIGKGSFGTVYHGHLTADRSQVAVKLLCQGCQASQQFQTEAKLLIKLYHRNLVRLVGYCAEGDKIALVFEYMSKGSLRKYISENEEHLSWSQRLRIAVDVAQGLEYLHTGCWPPIIHRDVKPENILLNERFDAKITDFRISKVFNNCNTHVTTEVKGTVGYLDPEYYTSHNLTEKSDVYSFGVVLLQLITGQEAIIQTTETETIDVANWVSPIISKGDIDSIIDPRLDGQYNTVSAWKAIEIAITCTRPGGVQRPAMSEVVAELKDCLKFDTAGKESIDSGVLLSIPSDNSLLFPASR